ncbi:MAG: flavin reductase family protein [Armatimonadetes bacterium]|nr:flavin reductase family protein [Armatimonadota bacterium]
MNFDLTTLAPREAYKLLTGVVVPRPIALVTSRGENGMLNAAPFSFFNLVGSNPPLVVLGVGNKSEATPKDTATNIRSAREFVVNMVPQELVGAMNICAVDFPAEISEIEAAGLEIAPSSHIATPRLARTPAALECREHSTLFIGQNRLIIGEVVALYIRDEWVDADKNYVQSAALKLVGRMGGAGGYTDTSGTFELARISFEEWKNGAR